MEFEYDFVNAVKWT